MISPTTFEEIFRKRLLDIVYAQWTAFGAPFSTQLMYPDEVIDPEALLWCSLEFIPTEPRLAEVVVKFVGNNQNFLVRHRLQKKSSRNDSRAIIWQALDKRLKRQPGLKLDPTSEPCHGLDSISQVIAFSQQIKEQKVTKPDHVPSQRVGPWDSRPAVLLVRARLLIGQDIRHFLLVYLLAHPHGSKLREIQKWSGYSYRSLSEAATGWFAADIASLDGGYCRLNMPDPWLAILRLRGSRITTVNWLNLFELSIGLLHNLAKARRKGLDEKSPVQISLIREAAAELTSMLNYLTDKKNSSVNYLLEVFSNHEL